MKTRELGRPSGTSIISFTFPALKRWAKVGRPSGAGFHDVSFALIICTELPQNERPSVFTSKMEPRSHADPSGRAIVDSNRASTTSRLLTGMNGSE